MHSNDSFLHWLAGLLDGEGCFFAQFYPAEDGRMPLTHRCEITLRADDKPLLEEIQRKLSLGKVTERPSRGANWLPTAVWRVSNRDECLRLIEFLDQVPLRSKKRRDYGVWREIITAAQELVRGGRGARLTNQPKLDKITSLIQQLQEVRTYDYSS